MTADTPSIAGWRDAAAALCHCKLQLSMTLAIILVADLYLLCLVAATWVALVTYVHVVGPVFIAMFGHVPAAFVTQLAVGAIVGGPLCRINVWLMYRAANRWLVRPKGHVDA